MNAIIVIMFLIFEQTVGQINGEFWWLNGNLSKYKETRKPRFEELSEFDTDESSKIIFRDNDLIENESKEELGRGKLKIKFQDKSKIAWPAEPMILKNNKSQSHNDRDLDENRRKPDKKDTEDVFDFKFPDTSLFVTKNKTKTNDTSTKRPDKNNKDTRPNRVMIVRDKLPVNMERDVVPQHESICTFLKNAECNRRGGIAYVKYERGIKKPITETQIICCILPLKKDLSGIIYFPDYKADRIKRSNDDTSSALNQRKALLIRKYPQALKLKPLSTETSKVTHKVVTSEDEYADPYANIKTSKFTRPSGLKVDYDSNNDDYVDDYVVELPTPGLVGLYSDNGNRPGWSYEGVNVGASKPIYEIPNDTVEEDDDVPQFGYGTGFLDPRLQKKKPSTFRPIGRPAKLTTHTASDELTYNVEAQTINYHSNPDYHVLQGFKLNLVRNSSRIYKNQKRTTTESTYEDSRESVLVGSTDFEYDDVFDTNQEVSKGCGRVFNDDSDEFDSAKSQGETSKGSHPWLAVVVLTRRQQSILCYAAIIHARAAVTAGDCVYGRACPGEITLIAGAWDLKEREDWQRRLASAKIHDSYTPGRMAHNLALLYWKRPLALNANVQPACLTDPHVGDSCRFYGWGGYDQAINSRSRWQRGTILTPRVCKERLSNLEESIPNDAFCAAVNSKGTVTGVGGPLVCSVAGRVSCAGVAVRKDRVVVLTAAHEWAQTALTLLT